MSDSLILDHLHDWLREAERKWDSSPRDSGRGVRVNILVEAEGAAFAALPTSDPMVSQPAAAPAPCHALTQSGR